MRNLFPGSAFLLFVSILNLDILLTLAHKETAQIILPVLGLISAPAIGFLTSQFWWFLFHLWEKRRFSRKIPCRKQQPELKWAIDNIKNCPKVDYIKTTITYVYCVNALIKKSEKGIFEYITRRWDVYHTLGSTALSILLALSTTFIRLIINYLHQKLLINLPKKLLVIQKTFSDFSFITGLVWVIGFILVIITIFSLSRPRKQWEAMAVFLLTQNKEEINKCLQIPLDWKKKKS